ncbi:MAG: methyltransferase domain-containing protein [Geobacteraceae bacterium]|nr:methyltransferase domain-containing protein [Geobacteraceae bacterium]
MSTDFSGISARYEHDSLIQKSAAEKLFGLLAINKADDVLDLGCGTGNLTRKLRGMTEGRVVGVDPSEGMIREAASQAGNDISHMVIGAEDLAFDDEFDVILCNSAFQWFGKPQKALANCCNALRKGGRMGIQAPARMNYCPNFISAIEAVACATGTKEIFAGFRPPWFFLETADEYGAIFKEAGFSVPFARIEELTTLHSAAEVMTIFESGAAAGYLNQEFYEIRLDAAYCDEFRRIVKDTFTGQGAENGKVELLFNRIYLVAVKG